MISVRSLAPPAHLLILALYVVASIGLPLRWSRHNCHCAEDLHAAGRCCCSQNQAKTASCCAGKGKQQSLASCCQSRASGCCCRMPKAAQACDAPGKVAAWEGRCTCGRTGPPGVLVSREPRILGDSDLRRMTLAVSRYFSWGYAPWFTSVDPPETPPPESRSMPA